MPSHVLSPTARRFLTEDVDSVLQLELLLLLHRDATVAWTPDGVSRELRAPEPWVADQLTQLTLAGPLVQADDHRYAFNADDTLAPTVTEIAALYPQRRATLIELIFGDGELANEG